MKGCLNVVALASALALALAQMSCEHSVTESFFINKDCKLESAEEAEITEVDLDQGQIIVWTNLKSTQIRIKFDVLPDGTGWMLPGELTILPHSNAVSTIRTGVVTGEYGWTIFCEGAESTGKIHLPPPQPGSGSGEGGG